MKPVTFNLPYYGKYWFTYYARVRGAASFRDRFDLDTASVALVGISLKESQDETAG